MKLERTRATAMFDTWAFEMSWNEGWGEVDIAQEMARLLYGTGLIMIAGLRVGSRENVEVEEVADGDGEIG